MNENPDDVERSALSLFEASLDAPSPDRRRFIETAVQHSPATRLRALRLLDADACGEAGVTTGGAPAGVVEHYAPARIGVYRIVRLIGAGGMGAVYLAERDAGDFEQTVAIKVIRPGVLSPTTILRFHTERKILAGLSDPGIASLYDGGALPDGSPFMVMEFVDGAPITAWASARRMPLPDRVSLFMQVVKALGHAHQNLIVHRDITPSNVLVTAAGDVKLIDFGIAKPMASGPERSADSSPVSLAGLSFTPGFAAPERALGGAATTLTDIYSLGKLLEALCQGTSTPADLRSVIARATREEPGERYASTGELWRDLERFLRIRPVSAHPGGLGYRLGKFARREALAVGAGAFAALCLIGGLATTTLMYVRAESQRADAARRFEDVRALAGFMMFDLYDDIEKLEGSTASLRKIAEMSQRYLASLDADPRASDDLRREAALGFLRLADILGNPKNANLGMRDEARPLLATAVARLEALYAEDPLSRPVIRGLADAHFARATFAYVADDDAETTLEASQEALRLYAGLAARADASAEDRRLAIRAKLMTGVPLPWMGRDREGVDVLREVLGDATRYHAENPDDAEAVNFLSSVNVELARALIRLEDNTGERQEILPYWNDAIALRREAASGAPDDMRPQKSLVILIYERGAHQRSRGLLDAALADMDEATAIGERLLKADPADQRLARMMSGVAAEKALVFSALGRHGEAISLAREAAEAKRSQLSVDPGNAGRLREWAYNQGVVATIHLAAGNAGEACAAARAGRQSWSELDRLQGLNEADRRHSVAKLDAMLGDCP